MTKGREQEVRQVDIIKQQLKRAGRQLLPPIMLILIRKIQSAKKVLFPRSPVEYPYKGFSIELPANHLLPMYQRSSPKYDRFLPHLVKFLKSGETVIDVGANVGDSLAAMAENNSAVNYICIEPDDTFFHFLTRNISRIKSAISDLKVYPVKSLVGKNVLNAVLEGKDGTKHAVINKNGTIQSRTLSEILVDLPSISNIRILKSDVDGFDYDVLDSSLDVMRDHRPMIFFECQYDCDYQKIGYEKMLSILEEEGYCDWIVFDNYGECVARTSDIKIVVQLIEYVWAQNIGNAYRTIYYYDILSVQNKDKGLIDRVLASYN